MNPRLFRFTEHKAMLKKHIVKLIADGVIFIDPENVYIEKDVKIHEDTIIHPNVHIGHKVSIRRGVVIKPFVVVENSYLGENCLIESFSKIKNSIIGVQAKVGPYAQLYKSTISSCAEVANAEIVRSQIGSYTKIKHHSYIGDAYIGNRCNIGAGTVFCNFDGKEKHRSMIEDDVFIGSGCMIISPRKIKKESFIAAGSIIDKDVPSNALIIARCHINNPYISVGGNRIEKVGRVKKTEKGWEIIKKSAL